MSGVPEALCLRISEMRRGYVEANNRIAEQIEEMCNEFRRAGEAVPELSVGVVMYVEDRIRHIREIVVDQIAQDIGQFKTMHQMADDVPRRRRSKE